MAVTQKASGLLFQAGGTIYSSGEQNYLDEQASVPYDYECDNNKTTLPAVAADVATNHPTFNGIPLHSVRVHRYGTTKAIALARYRHKPFSFPQTPGTVLASYRTAQESHQMYLLPFAVATPNTPAFHGTQRTMPNGDFYDRFGENYLVRPPKTYAYQVPVVQFQIRAELSVPPQVDHLTGRVNSDAITYGPVGHQVSFAAGELRFDGMVVNWREDSSGYTYDTTYSFTFRDGGHFRQYVKPNATAWVAENGVNYRTAVFTGTFPV